MRDESKEKQNGGNTCVCTANLMSVTKMLVSVETNLAPVEKKECRWEIQVFVMFPIFV